MNYGQRVGQSYNYATPSTSKELVVVPQNNYVHEEEWCNTCNVGHFWWDCPHVLEARRQDVLKGKLTVEGEVNQQGNLPQQGNQEATLMNFNEDEAIVVANFNPNQVWRPVAKNTRSKAQVANDH